MPILDQEIIEFEPEDDSSDEVHIEYDIASYPSDYTLSVLFKMWNDEDITIPDFQRSFVWTIQQSSLLIESFLVGLPVPPMFLYIDKVNKNLVVDGQQRLLSVVFFLEGLFGHENDKGKRQVFRLTGLSPRSPYHLKRFSDLSPSDQRKLENSVLRAINIRQLSPDGNNTSIYHIFERLNTGGTPLTTQEIRNVVYRGNFFKELKELNADTHWRQIMGKVTPDKHQKDVELILRAFALTYHLDEYEKPMKEFLNRISGEYRTGVEKNVVKFIKLFPAATNIIVNKIKPKAFNIRGPLNTSAFDAIFCAILTNVSKIPTDIKSRYDALLADPSFKEYTSIGTTDGKTVKDRFRYVKAKLID